MNENEWLLHSKGNDHQTEETANKMVKIFASYASDKELTTRIYWKLEKLTS
jgi:hypothetical protein